MYCRRLRPTVCALLAAAVGLLSTSTSGLADDWPQWRGPQRDGVWRETGITDHFDGPKLKLRWSLPIAGGYTGPTVADGRVYVMDRITEPAERERVLCFNWTDGAPLWSHEYDCKYTIEYRAGPRASVTIDESRAYALGSMGHLNCLDAATGEVLWKKDPVADFQTKVPIWGVAGSPLVEGDLLVVMAGGPDGRCVVALDKRTGELRWAAVDDALGYSTLMIATQAGRRVLVCWTEKKLSGLDPATGEIFWESPFIPKRWADQIITPQQHKDRLFVSSFADGCLMLKLREDRPAVEELWRRGGRDERNTDALHILMGNPVITDDYIYGVDSYGEFRCITAAAGDRIWEDKTITTQTRWGTAHMVVQGERVWVFNDAGELILARLTPKGFETISRAQLLKPTRGQLNKRDGVTWSHPAFAYKHIFNRNDEELVCASLAAEDH
ncbi:MAG: PQQ-binding-like beta-propeller repeat protein [Planctomycetota bacterium]